MVRALGAATVHMYESTPAGHGTILKAKPGVTPEDVLEATLKVHNSMLVNMSFIMHAFIVCGGVAGPGDSDLQ